MYINIALIKKCARRLNSAVYSGISGPGSEPAGEMKGRVPGTGLISPGEKGIATWSKTFSSKQRERGGMGGLGRRG